MPCGFTINLGLGWMWGETRVYHRISVVDVFLGKQEQGFELYGF